MLLLSMYKRIEPEAQFAERYYWKPPRDEREENFIEAKISWEPSRKASIVMTIIMTVENDEKP